MDYRMIEERMNATYRTSAADYRKADERDVTGEDHKRLGQILGMLSASFGRPITVLELGCGTGRYFHCLKNTRKLVGLDICQEMLDEARSPVKGEEVSIDELELLRGSLFSASFPAASFDLIYSIGVFGNGCGVTRDLLGKFYQWLAPDGRVFFDVIDSSGLPPILKARRTLRKILHQFLHPNVRNLITRDGKQNLPLHLYSKAEIVGLLESCSFFPVAVYPHECQMPLGKGVKLQCLGTKALQCERNPTLKRTNLLMLTCLETMLTT